MSDQRCMHGVLLKDCMTCNRPMCDTFILDIDNKGNPIPPTVFVSSDGGEPMEVETYLG